tara:strand:+ start:95 stop:949 length:855 start_codon:yes stop_codon:yes gene_type:complete
MMNRKEFKELLVEWHSNLITERGKFEYLVKKEAIKPCTVIALNFDQAKSLKDFLSDSNQIEILQDVSTRNLGFGKIIPSNEDTKSKLASFFNSIDSREVSNQLEVANKHEPIIIASAFGDNISDGSGEDSDIFYWLIHDLEHIIYGENSVLGEYNKGWSSWAGAYEDYTVEINNNKEGYPEDNELDDSQMEGFLNHLALDKFFNEIKFTGGVGANDFPASIFAYCITKMDNKEDFDIINNATSIDSSEKERIKSIFSNAYIPSNSQIDLLINKLKNKILVCLEY